VSTRRGCLGCSFPVLIVIIIIVLAVGVISFLSGALGKAMIGDVGLPEIFTVDAPHVQLPAEEIFHIGGFAVTNTLIASWITIIVLVALAWAVTHRIKLIPSRLQNLLEFAIEWLLNLCVDIAGEKNGRRFFPIITTIFLFVLMNSWLSLVPGFGSITYTVVENGEEHVLPLLRGANTDINFTLALSIVSFIFVTYFGISQSRGLFFKQFFNASRFNHGVGQLVRGKVKSGLSDGFFGAINLFVSFLELISYFIRLVSFAFRLFGNMLGGEILILMMLFIMPFLLAVPFYGLELLVGAIQALIFSGLTLVFVYMAVTLHEHEEAH